MDVEKAAEMSDDAKHDLPQGQELSLEELSQAYAQAMGRQGKAPAPAEEAAEAERPEHVEDAGPRGPPPEAEPESAEDEDAAQLSPETIFEAMLFVGDRENQPLAPARAAELMRGVEADEVPELVDRLNRRYAANGCPYQVASQGDGYRLVLRNAFHAVRRKFYGKAREARLSQAAIDILAIVAYQQPLTGEAVSKLRGTPSSHILSQLVRRQLLRIDRPEGRRHPTYYYTTDRFLELFGLESLEDLPQAEEAEVR